MSLSILNKVIASIEDGLPSPKYYTQEAYDQLVDRVINEIFSSKVEKAIKYAQNYLCWNKDTERWETYYD